MNKNFYYLHMVEDDDGGTAYSPDENNIEFINELKGLNKTPFKFIFREGIFQDYINNELAWPIFSEKFKNITDKFIFQDSFLWIETEITTSYDNKIHNAFILVSNKDHDVLDKNKTIFATDNVVVKPVLSQEKTKDLDLFFVPGSNFRIIITEKLKSEIESNNLTGMAFSKVPVSGQ